MLKIAKISVMNGVCWSAAFYNQDRHPTCDMGAFSKKQSVPKASHCGANWSDSACKTRIQRPGKAPVFLIPGLESSLDTDSIGQMIKCPTVRPLSFSLAS
jgi:hypothetical protein